MPRSLVPSPNEEAWFKEEATQKLKIERLVAARKQSLQWCRRKTNNQSEKNRQKQISVQLQATKSKLSDLKEKGDDIKEELDIAMASVGEAFDDADKENAAERDAKRAKLLEDYKTAAAKRHRAALKQLNEVKERQRAEETQLLELKKETRAQENTRTKQLLKMPLQNSQPLIEVPSLQAAKKPALQGLDAFTKTYYHLPVSGIGVVHERSLAVKEAKDAKTLASEVEKMMEECRSKLKQSKQAREERADVRGSAALQKVQLKNVLEDVTSQLDRYAVYNRTRKQPSTLRTNVFASNLARESTQKQHQIDLEHAVEDIFDRHTQVVDMVLPSSVKFENVDYTLDTVEEKSEIGSVLEEEVADTKPEALAQVTVSSPSMSDTSLDKDPAIEDNLAAGSRPSLNLYFPLHSDLSSEQSPDRADTMCEAERIMRKTEEIEADSTHDTGLSHYTVEREGSMTCDTGEDTIDLEPRPITPLADTGKMSPIQIIDHSLSFSASSNSQASTSTLKRPSDTTICNEDKMKDVIEQRALDLSSLIKDQLKLNSELKALGKPLNTSVNIEEVNQPPPISYIKTTPHNLSLQSKYTSTPSTSSGKSSSSFEEIIQSLLTSSQVSSDKSGGVSRASDSLSQHTLSQNSSLVSETLPPGLVDHVIPRDLLTPGVVKRTSLSGGSWDQSKLASRDVSSASSGGSSSSQRCGKLKSESVSSGLSELQKQLARINSHLSEIEKIKDTDNLIK
ncbi:uncharacterized protein LOC134819324 [Bolinopsis microptera]|uniref:uncharacterized protein LOC134819324 n=1 Tax=Bolinopsis microptera TaxID=2820187 RepID=UPI003078D0ED